jgi:hypothetical protein
LVFLIYKICGIVILTSLIISVDFAATVLCITREDYVKAALLFLAKPQGRTKRSDEDDDVSSTKMTGGEWTKAYVEYDGKCDAYSWKIQQASRT